MPKIAIVTVSDRASAGVYEDLSGPAVFDWLKTAVEPPYEVVRRLIPDGEEMVSSTLAGLCDDEQCDLVLVAGGTGPDLRDQTPEGVARIAEKYLPGFGEAMRRANLAEVPTAILSRQEAVTRGKSLIITLPGKPAAIATSLNAIFAAVPYCLDLIGAARLSTDPLVAPSFRPKPH
ncbi:molybdopterin adenylyltransferase [Pannonibacter carbonis]|uniref:molybdopterin adenylyltransferase n=1 Tax=Pannonibacter carbonis TaxID=2067569 RepID=UPI000D109F00|nr:molybdopterin adenylyltransferase [Pannonibacter carbonis]